jgi:hypothetical protein
MLFSTRQGMVCSDPESFFQDQNTPTKNPSRALRLAV